LPICKVQGVESFPTLLLFENNKVETYGKERTVKNLEEYAIKTTPTKSYRDFKAKITWLENSDVLDHSSLNIQNWNQEAEKGAWLLLFYAPWCGFCSEFIPEFEKVASELKGNVKLVRLNIEGDVHSKILNFF